MDIELIIYIFVAFLIASFLKGLTGIGFNTLSLALLAAVLEMTEAIPVVIIPSLLSNLMVMMDAGGFRSALRRFWLLYLIALPGLIGGIWLLDRSSQAIPKCILGTVMIFYAIYGIRNDKIKLNSQWEKKLMAPVGLLSGFVNGITGSQIMPIMPYLLSLNIDKNLFVQSINTAFTINSILMLSILGKFGYLSLNSTYISLAGILPLILGIYLGTRLRKRTSEQFYRRIVYWILLVLGFGLVFKFCMPI